MSDENMFIDFNVFTSEYLCATACHSGFTITNVCGNSFHARDQYWSESLCVIYWAEILLFDQTGFKNMTVLKLFWHFLKNSFTCSALIYKSLIFNQIYNRWFSEKITQKAIIMFKKNFLLQIVKRRRSILIEVGWLDNKPR